MLWLVESGTQRFALIEKYLFHVLYMDGGHRRSAFLGRDNS